MTNRKKLNVKHESDLHEIEVERYIHCAYVMLCNKSDRGNLERQPNRLTLTSLFNLLYTGLIFVIAVPHPWDL